VIYAKAEAALAAKKSEPTAATKKYIGRSVSVDIGQPNNDSVLKVKSGGRSIEMSETDVTLVSKIHGAKTIPLASIQSIEFQEGGALLNGYLRFFVTKDRETNSNRLLSLVAAGKDANAFVFTDFWLFGKGNNERVRRIKDKIEAKILSHTQSESARITPKEASKEWSTTKPQDFFVPTTKSCPFCKEQVHFEAVKCKHCGSKIGSEENTVVSKTLKTKACPNCAEQVKGAATICPYCKHPIFATKPGTNAIVSLVVFAVMFFVLYKGLNLFVESEAEKSMVKINADAERTMSRIRLGLPPE
jgi:RNA polymerase subunit RPABC4/transcription elongation factor Spt4